MKLAMAQMQMTSSVSDNLSAAISMMEDAKAA